MNILWVSPFLPHPNAGHAGGQAVHRWISGLAPRHAITLACRIEPHEAEQAELIRPLLRAVHLLHFARPGPGLLQAARIAASYVRLGRLASRLLDQGDFDLVHVDWLETGLGLGRRRRVPRVAVAIDELTKPARRRFELAEGRGARAAAWLTWRATVAVQRRVSSGCDAVLAMCEQDRQALMAVDRGLRATVLPFPVAIEPVRPDDASRDSNHLLFVGAMNRDVNVAAVTHVCRDILPLVRKQYPDVRLTIAGAAPTEHVRRLASEPSVEVTGFVADLAPYYARATLMVSPLRVGGGIISKNLDAMAAGCPVVTSTIGNEGIGATPGTHVLTADGPEAFARTVITALGDGALRRRLAERGRAFVRARFSAEASAAVLERVHADVVSEPRGARRAKAMSRPRWRRLVSRPVR